MFATVDYLITAGIQKRLDFLKHNPHHLAFIFSKFVCDKDIMDIVGPNYLKDAVEFITNNKLHVAPAYNLDENKLPSVAIISSGSESQQFLGDYGAGRVEKSAPPVIYDWFDANEIKGSDLIVSENYNFDKKLWRNIHIGNGTFITTLESVYNSNGKTVLALKDPIPEETSLKQWATMSDDKYRAYRYSASIDDITASITLTTSGSYSIHYLFSIVLRYCLKANRMYFDNHGFQVSTSKYSIPVINDQVENIFQSNYTLEGKFTEYWIDHEFDLPDSGPVNVCLFAESTNPKDAIVSLRNGTKV